MEITRDMVDTYRIVRRHFAEEDVRSWFDSHDEEECDADKYEHFDELVDAYDAWQSENEFWYEAIGDLKWDIDYDHRRERSA